MVGTVNGRLFHICDVHGGALDEPRLVAEEFDLERSGYVREVGQSGQPLGLTADYRSLFSDNHS